MASDISPALLSKLAPEMNLQLLQKVTSTPSFDQTSQQISQLNPENLTALVQQVPAAFGFTSILDSIPTLPSSKILNGQVNQITQGIDIVGQFVGTISQIQGNIQIPNFGGGDVNIDSIFENTFNQLAQRSASSFSSSQSQVGSVFQTFQNVSNISSVLNSIQTSLPSNISPKQIRDLNASPQNLNNFVNTTAQKANSNVQTQAISNAQTYTNNAAGANTTQAQSSPIVPNASSVEDFKVKAVVTTYGKGEKVGSGGDKWTARGDSATGQGNLVEGISCAVDPSIIPYGSKIVFQDPRLGTRVAMDTGSAVVSQKAARSRGISLGNENNAPVPYEAGSGAASTDQTVRTGGRGSKLSGNLILKDTDGTILGKYKFVNGGSGRGNIPFGTYTVSNYMTAQQRQKAGRSQRGSLRGQDTFDLNDVYDPVYSDTRSGLLIHPAANATEGCIGIQENWPDFREKMKYLMSKNGGNYKIEFGPDANTVNNRNPERVVTVDVYFETEKSRQAFEKVIQEIGGGGTVAATVQPPRNGVIGKNVRSPSGRTTVAYYPKGYERFKNPSSEQLLKAAGLI